MADTAVKLLHFLPHCKERPVTPGCPGVSPHTSKTFMGPKIYTNKSVYLVLNNGDKIWIAIGKRDYDGLLKLVQELNPD